MQAHASRAMAIKPRALENVFMVISVEVGGGLEMGSGWRMLCVLTWVHGRQAGGLRLSPKQVTDTKPAKPRPIDSLGTGF
jgi:hypothetical protein